MAALLLAALGLTALLLAAPVPRLNVSTAHGETDDGDDYGCH